MHSKRRTIAALLLLLFALRAAHADQAAPSPAAKAYLDLIENFLGFAEKHWNESTKSYDAAGSGVTWARGNGGVCLVAAILMTEYPDRDQFSSQNVSRKVLLEHVRETLRTLCLTSNVCNDPRAKKPGTWGGVDPSRGGWHWQAGLETEHWVMAAHLLRSKLDADTLELVRQVAGAEADGAAERQIQSARPGDTAADDACWNAGILGVCAAIYADDPRAKKWDEWAKRWALNMEGREPDRKSTRVIDGKPLGEWLVANNANPDLTIVNHRFWDLPYQTSFAALVEPIIAYRICNRPIPEAFYANVKEEGDQIMKWLAMPDGDLLCPQGIDWAERDVQHSWAFTELGTFLDQPWARAVDARCVDFLTKRQAAFGDGSIHALDFGYETDLATIWAYSYLLHKYYGKEANGKQFEEPLGAKIYPYVNAAVFRSPDLVSSVTWYPTRQGIMVSPNNLKAMKDRPAFTRWNRESGTGWVMLVGDKKHSAAKVIGETQLNQENGCLTVSYTREMPEVARQNIAYCALPSGAVAVFSKWTALKDSQIAELVDHPFQWVEIDNFVSKPEAKQDEPGVWNIDNLLQLQVLGNGAGEATETGVNGIVRRDFAAGANETLLDSVCVYQPIVDGKAPAKVKYDAGLLRVGEWEVIRGKDGALTVKSSLGTK